MSAIVQLPTPPEWKRRNVSQPPNMVYTSPKSMEYIRDHNRVANVNFDIVEEQVSKWGRGRGRGQGRGRGRKEVKQMTGAGVEQEV